MRIIYISCFNNKYCTNNRILCLYIAFIYILIYYDYYIPGIAILMLSMYYLVSTAFLCQYCVCENCNSTYSIIKFIILIKILSCFYKYSYLILSCMLHKRLLHKLMVYYNSVINLNRYQR